MLRIYRQPDPLEDLVVGADPGEGVSYCGAVAVSKRHKDIPLVFHSRIESAEFGVELYRLGRYVLNRTTLWPLLAIERNIGQATILKVRDLDYPTERLYHQRSFDRVTEKEEVRIGWVTTSANRRKMLDELAFDIKNKNLKIYDDAILSEMLTFVINARTNEPRPEAGRFSDLIMATAIALQVTRISLGDATWQHGEPENPKFVPKTAAGFIVEKFEEPRDWRSA